MRDTPRPKGEYPRICAECREHDASVPLNVRGAGPACRAYPGIRVKPLSRACGTRRSQLRDDLRPQASLL